MPGGVSALIVGLQPLITAFIAAPALGETIDRRHWLGLVTGIIGVALVLTPKFSWATLGGITPTTAGAVIFGTIAAAAGTVYQKRYAAKLPLLSSVFWQYVGASIIVIIVAAVTESFRFDATPQAWGGLAWALIISVAAILLLMLLIREGAVAKVSTLIFLVPGVTALMTFTFFGETLTAFQIIGMVVTAAAVLIVNRRKV
jgi:drug/metabolite transporter (DMT)-like permease